MRQQAILAIQETVASFLLKEDAVDTREARVRQHASALERKKHRRALARGSSLKNDKFDYVENAATTSSLSTPTNDVGESPFSRDSLGETVIHLDKALAKMRREMQQADQERAERVRDAMETKQEGGGDGGGDQGSESSVSDMPYPRIDAQELDQQIKGVMGQVIPVIKEHINDVCSPQLLAYIQRLVLSLPPASKSTQAGMVGEEYDAAGDESDNEASDDKDDDDDDDTTPQDIRVNGEEEEEEDLGKDRDDELARKMAPQSGQEKEEDTEGPFSTSEVHIQLAMSETKPFTRIGSDEDTEGSDESLSIEDPSDTAVSHMMELRHNDPSCIASAATNISANASAPQQKEAAMAESEEKEADTSEADGTLEASGTADGSRGNVAGSADASGAAAGDDMKDTVEVVQMNGEVGGMDEELAVGVDDLPPALNVTDPEAVEQRRQAEEAGVSGISAVLNSMDTSEELVGDGSALKEPGE
nr:hypothetical protein BaRGS_026094 [Batillaria attramentaria]